MFYCEPCRVKHKWTKGVRGFPTSSGGCEVCRKQAVCYDVPSYALEKIFLESDDKPESQQPK